MGAFSHLTYAAKSDIGKKRKNNEDSFGVFPSLGVFCVADGMGGGDDGEVASAATIRAIETFVTDHPMPPKAAYSKADLVASLRGVINGASRWIADRAREKHLKGCGSTFVGICFDASQPDMATALHAGDSRLYRIRGRSIQQITKDHSAAELIGAKDESQINPMFRGMILRAVGIQPTVEVDATPVALKEGDRILICSDGLSKMVPDKKILSLVRENPKVEKAVNALIAAANDAGGVDNVTVEIIEVGSLPAPLPVLEMSPEELASRQDTQDSTESDTRDTSSGTSVSTFAPTMGTVSSTFGGLSEHGSLSGMVMGVPEKDSEDKPVSAPESEPSVVDFPEETKEEKPAVETSFPDASVRRVIIRYLVGVVAVGVMVMGFLLYKSAQSKTEVEAKAKAEAEAEAKVKVAAEAKAKEAAAAKAEAKAKAKAQAEVEAKAKVEAERKAKEAAVKAKAEAERKAKAEAKAKEAAVAKARAKAEAERKAKEKAEDERMLREKAENARLDALLKEREAKENAQRAEQQRKLAAQKAADAARRAEEQRKIEEEHRKEAEAIRKAEEKTKAVQKAENQMKAAPTNNVVSTVERLKQFEEVSVASFAVPFVRNVETTGQVEPKKIEKFSELFGALRKNSKKTESERIKVAAEMTALVQTVAHSLREYAELSKANSMDGQNDATLSPKKRAWCAERVGLINQFLEVEKAFASGKPEDQKTQALCTELIRSKFQWISENP